MVSLTFFGGVNEIGGNKILLEDRGTRIFLDFGMSFNQTGRYFSEFLQPRKCNGVDDLIEFGLLPDLNGLYRRDYLQHKKKEFTKDALFQGVLLSHAHFDHSAHIHYLRHDIPIFCSHPTRLILQALQDTTSTGTSEFIKLVESFQMYVNKKGEWSRKTRRTHEELVIPRPIKTFTFGKKFKIDSLEIVPFSVDHSLPGATAYIIYTSEGPVVYTGDIRLNGRRSESSLLFMKKAAEAKPAVLISEGTRVDERASKTEGDVENEIQKYGNRSKELVVANWPIRDTDRMLSFLNASKTLGRKLAISTRQAYLLNLLKECKDPQIPNLENENIVIYAIRKDWGLICRKDFPERIRRQDYEKWEQEFLEHPRLVEHEKVGKDQGKYVFFCTNYDLKELTDVQPKAGSIYIKSVCEPFDIEMEIDWERVENWLRHFKLRTSKTHVSGHVSSIQIKQMIRQIRPRLIIPVHTEHPNLFKKLAPRIRVLKLKLAQTYSTKNIR